MAEEVAVEEEDILDQAATAQETDTAAEEIGAIPKDEEIEAIHQEIEEIGVIRHPGTEETEAIHVIKIEKEVEIEEEEVDPDLDLIVQDTGNHRMIVEIAIIDKIKEEAERNLMIEIQENMIIQNLNQKKKKWKEAEAEVIILNQLILMNHPGQEDKDLKDLNQIIRKEIMIEEADQEVLMNPDKRMGTILMKEIEMCQEIQEITLKMNHKMITDLAIHKTKMMPIQNKKNHE